MVAPGGADPASVGELLAVVNRLVDRIADWTPARWSRSIGSAQRAPEGTGGSASSESPALVSSESPALVSSEFPVLTLAGQRRAGHGGGDSTRADLVHALVRRLAQLSADVEGQPRREVPRLENDLALRDQLRVVVADLIRADPPGPTVAEATELVRRVNRTL